MVPIISTELLHDVLHDKFKQERFRSSQFEIIQSVLNGEDVLVILPTGHGKSLTFQLPAVVQSEYLECKDSGFYIVISPLLALMEDQVRQLQALGIAAETINSTTTPVRRQKILDTFLDLQASLLYVSPEQCFTSGFRAFLDQLPTSKLKRIVIDEAHCAVEWGSDFRRDYARLGNELRSSLRTHVPFMALTGTASPRMQTQIVKALCLKSPRIFQGPSERPNLHYEVRYVESAGDRVLDLLKFLKMYRGRVAKLCKTSRTSATKAGYQGCGIIYCRNRSTTELIAERCNEDLGQCAVSYHAGLPTRERNTILENWVKGDPNYSIVVATIAFGLGIDKPDTRFVIHFELPQNMEAYVQQIGRAGRDRKAARCILYYSLEESQRCQRFVKDPASTESTVALLKFATTINKCRHNMLANYFGNAASGSCEYACDHCKMPKRLRQRYEEWYSQVE